MCIYIYIYIYEAYFIEEDRIMSVWGKCPSSGGRGLAQVKLQAKDKEESPPLILLVSLTSKTCSPLHGLSISRGILKLQVV